MKDFVPLGTGNSRFLKSVANFLTLYPNYASFAAALVAGTLPVDFNGINTAGIAQNGTPLNKSSLLTDATAAALGLTGDDPTVNEALAELAPTLASARVEFGSYTGTGVGGASNPCSLTFDEAPRCVEVVQIYNPSNVDGNAVYVDGGKSYGEDDLTNFYGTKTIILLDDLTTNYKAGVGFLFVYQGAGSGVSSNAYAKKSEDGKTIYWYSSASNSTYATRQQGNVSGCVYYYRAIF